MNSEYLKKHLSSFEIYCLDSVDSTNSYAKTLSCDMALITAEGQTHGRGRMGREFVSPKGTGLYMSLLVKISDMYSHIPFITTAASVAVHKALYEKAGVLTKIKWVNDIYYNGKKLSGILCESADSERAIIGIGINLSPNNLPEVATALPSTAFSFLKEDLVISITKNLMDIISRFPDASFLGYYKSHSCVLGKDIICIQGDKAFNAKAVDIDSSGALIVETPDGIISLSTGEITIRFTD